MKMSKAFSCKPLAFSRLPVLQLKTKTPHALLPG